MRGVILALGPIAWAATGAVNSAAAQRAEPGEAVAPDLDGQVAAVRLTAEEAESLRLDGLLSEPFWRRAPAVDDLRQREPLVGEPATERTEVRIAWDDETLYVGVTAFDSEPGEVVARILQRDRIMSSSFGGGLGWAGDDGVAILLDTFHDHRNAVVFATNANGAEFDALVTDEGREVNVSWRGVWEVAATRTAEGWSAEFAIPFRSLRYPDGQAGQPWGFNVFRGIRRKNEEVLWRSWSRDNEGFHRVSRAGHLTGLGDLPGAGLNLEVKPYALAGTDQVLRDDGSRPLHGDVDVGLDLKTEIRPGLVLDATVNTDFAQVEVDDEQVNLTRFDLFYPEKRDFFLENAGIFELGLGGFGGPPPLMLFFSRRIGIGPEGEVPILGGARLTGRAGGQTLGLLNVVTGESGAVPTENFAVARVKRDLGDRDYVGLMVVDRRRIGAPRREGIPGVDPGVDPDLLHPANTVLGLDGSWWLTSRLQFQGFGAASATEGPGGDDAAFRMALDYTADQHGFFLQHLTVQPGFTTRSGFTLRTDLRQSQAFFRLSPRPDVAGLRRVDVRFSGLYQSRTDGAFQDWSGGVTVSPQWGSGDEVSLSYTAGDTRLDDPFVLAGQAPVPAGRYATDEWSWSASTTTARPVSVSHRGSRRELYGGRLLSLGGSVRLAPDPRVAAEVGLSRNDVDVPGGSFTTDVASMRLAWSFSTHLTTNALLQYNSLTERVSTNLRLNFIHRPGSDLFVVLTEARGDEEDPWLLYDRGFVVKLTWLQRL